VNDRAALLCTAVKTGRLSIWSRPGQSLLLELVRAERLPISRMPPKGPGLPAAEVALIRQWFAEGLPSKAASAFRRPLTSRR